jgi:hypothetical protein
MTALEQYALLEAEGDYFDGLTAAPQEVIVKFGEASLTLMTADDMPVTHWALASLRLVDGSGKDQLRLTPEPGSDERLTIRDRDMIAAIRAVCPDLTNKPRNRRELPKILFWAGGAIGAVLLIIFVLIPALAERLAVLIPPKQEALMGEQVVDQIVWILGKASGKPPQFCENPDGRRAIDAMTARMKGSYSGDISIRVRVLDHPMVNAFAAPGGQVLLFRGLIEAAESPEEVAAVLAHEIGHVEHRDPTRQALRAAGSAGVLGLVLGDFAGGALVLAITETVMNASYQREAEAAADEFAIGALNDARLPTSPFADFFLRIREKYGDADGILSHIASHPDLSERARAARAADAVGETPYTPALTDNQWIALRQICERSE